MDLVKLTSAISGSSTYVAPSEILYIVLDKDEDGFGSGYTCIHFKHSKKVVYVEDTPDEVYEILKKHEDDRFNSVFNTNGQFCYIGEKDVEGGTIECYPTV